MNDLLAALGWQSLKPMIGALLLPPTPLLLLAAWAAWRLHRGVHRGSRPRVALAALWALLAALWLLCTPLVGSALIDVLAPSPPPLGPTDIARLQRAPQTVILVLGAGRRHMAQELGMADLKPMTLQRLRHGAWLARQTGLPLAFTGGIGHGAAPGPSEAEVAQRVAAQELGQPLRWTESRSRDTRENAVFSLALLRAQGVRQVVLVTHGFHMARAMAAFEREAHHAGVATVSVVAAPIDLRPPREHPTWGDLVPGPEGLADTWLALHEWLGRLAGA